MKRQCLLLLDPRGISAWSWQRGQLSRLARFTDDGNGQAQFADFVRARRAWRFSLLVNLGDEERMLETLPAVRGRHRGEMLSRRLSAHFPADALTCTESIGYEKTQRRNERLLLAALSDTQRTNPWLERMAGAGAGLCGIYSAGQLAGPLLARLDPSASSALLLTLHENSLLECFVAEGRTWLTRLLPLAESSPANVADACREEAGHLLDYLAARRLTERNEPLRMTIVAPPPVIAALGGRFDGDSRFSCQLIEASVAATRMKAQIAGATDEIDALLLHQLAASPPRRRFANAEMRRQHRLIRWRRLLFAAGVVILLVGALFAWRQIAQAEALRTQATRLIGEAAELAGQRRRIDAALPALGIDRPTLRRLTDRHRELLRTRQHPEAALRSLSLVLDTLPTIRLMAVDWKSGTDLTSQASGDEIIGITAMIEADDSEDHDAIFNRFIAQLGADPRHQVHVVQHPAEDEATPRPFIVEVRRKTAP